MGLLPSVPTLSLHRHVELAAAEVAKAGLDSRATFTTVVSLWDHLGRTLTRATAELLPRAVRGGSLRQVGIFLHHR